VIRPIPRSVALLALALALASAQAGTVEQAHVVADLQMQVKGGAIQGCGYRLKGMPKDFAGSRSLILLDASFNFYSEGLALLKGGAAQVTVKEGGPTNPVNKPIESFWLKAPAEKPTTAVNNKVMPAETKGYLLYGVNVESVMSLFTAVWDKKPITIGVRIKGEPIDRIYVGTAQLSSEDSAQGNQRMDELLGQIQRELEATAPPARK
jgi:hypothetical protein